MKIKYILEGILLTFIGAMIFHMFTIDNVSSEIIHIKQLPLITKRFTSLNERISNIEDQTCRSSLDNMLNRIKKTYFNKDVTLKEYYEAYNEDEKNFIDFYEDVINSCNLESNDDIYFLVLASLNYPNSIKNRYDLRYEFSIRDIFNRESIYESSDEVGSYTTKLLEIQVIDKLLSEVNK